ncbi:MAG: bifunctional transaldolase/phosoglucose isomerase [Nitrospira sp.]|nr:bifunctional transaldolase/phosoglucose isomerase [Nitrospira sp.]
MSRFDATLGRDQQQVKKTLQFLDQQEFSKKLWAKDPSLWSVNPETQQKIRNRLGWLTVTETMTGKTSDLVAFARSLKDAAFTHAVLLGMGGSSLCPEVCREIYGVAEDALDLIILDSTDPATILRIEASLDLKRTLFIVASKSGTTQEVQSLYGYFYEKMKTVEPTRTGQHFVAITDPGTSLERLAQEQSFRKIFLNPPDIGGRYSALSYFGLVPAALIGMDLEDFLDRAEGMVQNCASQVAASENPGLYLGAVLGELGKVGRDKVTFITSPLIQSFGAWLEQLLAESTGKEGKGLIPVVGETIGPPAVYENDRLFIYLSSALLPDPILDETVKALQQAGHPVVRIFLQDSLDLGGEFFRWELATAVAGAILGINPFDEPNVTESKENTRQILQVFCHTGKLDLPTPILEAEGVRLYGNVEPWNVSPKDTLWAFLNQSRTGDYVTLMAYIERSKDHETLLQKIRILIRDRFHLATAVGYGPRFLHSTGQLHKGGPSKGLFLQITSEDAQDLTIPGEPYTFGILKKAQALGDYYSLIHKGLRVLHLHLGRNTKEDLKRLLEWLEDRIKE